MMICQNCQTTNPGEHSFCSNCGQLLSSSCPRCRFQAESDANFCGNCGLALSPRAQFMWLPGGDLIPTGGPVIPRAFESEARAGNAVSERPAETSPQTFLDQYIPRELRSKLEAARAHGGMEGERRVVTMLFCDVKGSTEAAGRLDPEEWTEIINGAFEYMIRPVYKYEGTVARLMGDGILAFFGAPIAHEDDPQRAVLTGLDIVSGLAPYRETIRQRWQIDINVRVGINTGLVVVGAVGSDLRMEYTAMGDAINLAARMEQTAVPGTIQIAQDTYKQVAPLFEVEDLGGIEVKGKSDPVPAYRVIGRKRLTGRTRGIEGLEAAMVGRDEELERLQAQMDGLSRGIGRIVCLIGGAGLGKSRLIQELKRIRPEDSGLNWYEVVSLSFEANDPYALFQQLVRRLNGISAGDDAAAFWEKINDLVSMMADGDSGRYTRVIAALFGQPDPSGHPPLEGEMFKRELYAVMREMWQARFSTQPAVMVLDDLHWADPASVDLLLHLLPIVESSPVLLLCAFRPDRSVPAYQVKLIADADYPHRYTEINLRPLSAEQSDELVNRLLSIAEIPDGLRTRIQERAAGNPFYVEEVVRTLIDNGAVIPEDRSDNGTVQRTWRAVSESAEIDIPDNLQGLLASRIDRLEERTRHVVQLASVIGRSFYHRVLAEIGKPDEINVGTLDEQVGRLVRLEMIQEAARVPDIEYRFRNPMTQEIAYRTILLKRRREFHLRVGEALERLFPDQTSELALRLAFHFSEAQAAEKALNYYTKAADNAFRLFALDEALRNYDQALVWAERGGASDEELVHLYQRRGRTLELQLRHNEALETYRSLEVLGERRDSAELRLAAIAALGVAYTVAMSDFEKSREYSERAYDLARELGDRYTEARSLWSLLLSSTWVDGEQALAFGNQGLAIARELAAQPDASSEVQELLALLLMDVNIPLIGAGQVQTARDYATEARELFEASGNLPMASTAAQRQGLAFKAEGRFAEAVTVYDQSTEMDLSMGNDGGLIGSSLGLLDIYPMVGDYAAFFDRLELLKPILERGSGLPAEVVAFYPMQLFFYLGAYQEIYRLAEDLIAFVEGGSLIWPSLFLSYLVRAEAAQGRLEEAKKAHSLIRPGSGAINYMIPLAALLPQMLAELALAAGDWQAALQYLDDFIERIRADGMLSFLPEKLLTRGRTLVRGGRPDEAREAFREAFELSVRQNARPMLWQSAVELAEIEAKKGREKEAQALYRQARTAIDFIAAHAGSEELAEGFLAQPRVQLVLEKTDGIKMA